MYFSLQQTTVNTLQQLIDVLLQLDANLYAQPLPVLSGGSVGKHVRHITEFYNCLFAGLESGFINYDARQRNSLLENCNRFAVQSLEGIIDQVGKVQADRALQLRACYAADTALLVPTTLYRELIYNLEHCIHHLATIRIGISAETNPYIVPKDFGVAPSTIQYRQSTCAQ